MEKNKKKVIITMIMIVSIITFFFVSKNIINKKYEKLPEVKLREIKKDKAIAIMISEDGSNYDEYEGEEWPKAGYTFKKAECVDNSGKIIENVITYEEETNIVKLETEKTVYCTMYFDVTRKITLLADNINIVSR